MKIAGIIGAILIFSLAAFAQDDDTVGPDRPSTSSSTHIVPVHHIQIEGGAASFRSGAQSGYDIGELLFRIGMAKRAEVGIGVPSYMYSRDPSGHVTGADDSSIDAKFLLKQSDRVSLGAMVQAALPTGSRSVAEHTFQPGAAILADIKVSDIVGITTNAIYTRATDSGSRFNDVLGVVTVNFALPANTSAFTEIYGHNSHLGLAPRFAGAGLAWTIRKKTALDASGGIGLGNDTHGPDRYWGVGITRLF